MYIIWWTVLPSTNTHTHSHYKDYPNHVIAGPRIIVTNKTEMKVVLTEHLLCADPYAKVIYKLIFRKPYDKEFIPIWWVTKPSHTVDKEEDVIDSKYHTLPTKAAYVMNEQLGAANTFSLD